MDAHPKITVGYTRDPAKVAADVQRRLILRYLEQYQEALARKARQDAHDAREEAMLKELGGLFGAIARYRSDGGYAGKTGEVRVYSQGVLPYVEITANGHTEKAKLVLQDVPFDTARQICRLVASNDPRH